MRKPPLAPHSGADTQSPHRAGVCRTGARDPHGGQSPGGNGLVVVEQDDRHEWVGRRAGTGRSTAVPAGRGEGTGGRSTGRAVEPRTESRRAVPVGPTCTKGTTTGSSTLDLHVLARSSTSELLGRLSSWVAGRGVPRALRTSP